MTPIAAISKVITGIQTDSFNCLATMLQSPTDPDATYREKAGKKYRGYVANVEVAVGSSGSVIVDYQLEQNIYSDSQFLQDRLERMEQQEEGTLFVTDGAYCGEF